MQVARNYLQTSTGSVAHARGAPTLRTDYYCTSWVHRFRDINVPGAYAPTVAANIVVSSTAEDMDPQISPDGSRLLYRSNRSGRTQIWMAARDGSDANRLTHFESGQVKQPHWSLDGKLVVFVATVALPRNRPTGISITSVADRMPLCGECAAMAVPRNWSIPGCKRSCGETGRLPAAASIVSATLLMDNIH